MKDYLAIGQVLKPHGIKGGIKVRVLSDHPDRFHDEKHIYRMQNNEYVKVNIESVSGEGDSTILFLDGVNSREDVEAMRREFFYIKRSEAKPLPEGNYYISDLMGCKVVDTNEKELGKIVDIMQTGAVDVYTVKKDGKELLFPALKRLLTKVDIENRLIIVDAQVLKEVADI